MVALAYIIQLVVLVLITLGLFIFGFSWVGVGVGLAIYLISTWLVSSMVDKTCPFCKSRIDQKAVKCPKCQSDLSSTT